MQTVVNNSTLPGEGLCGPLSARLVSLGAAGAGALGRRNMLFPKPAFPCGRNG